MYRYVAWIWNANSAAAIALVTRHLDQFKANARAWQVGFESPGFCLLHTGAEQGRFEVRSSNPHAVTVGRMFSPEHWGRYVQFHFTPPGSWRVQRDPSASMPCYVWRREMLTAAFSNLEDVRSILGDRLSINWSHIRAYLRFNRLVTAETGYNEVRQVRAGESLVLTPDTQPTAQFMWHPVPFVEALPCDEPRTAAVALREAVENSVRSWEACYPNILHELSGGLDSAIVLACLERPPLCLNLFTETPEGDERGLARKLATRFGCELFELVLRPTARDLTTLWNVANTTSPCEATLHTATADARMRLVADRSIDAVFTGQGGDQLFHRRRSPLIAAERLSRRWFSPGWLDVALDTARLAQLPLTSVLAAAARHALLKRRHDPYTVVGSASFFSAAEDDTHIEHPWVHDAQHLPAAKVQQIADLVDCQSFYAARCGYADVVHPLISQPVIECCLRIPAYTLTVHGIERSLIRAAFAERLPPEIIARTDKGEATGYYHSLVIHNLAAIREQLLDGWLVHERLLNRQPLERALTEGRIAEGYELRFILSSMMAEAWVSDARARSRSCSS